jgi:hypothetical protein
MRPNPPSPISVEDAIRAAPTLARLGVRIKESAARMDVVRPLLPVELRAQVAAGPVDSNGWRLLVANNAVAAKLRQLKPVLRAALQSAQLPVAEITVKVRKPPISRST